MARLDDAVAQLQREVSVERLASARGVKLKAHQGTLTGPCPFHAEGTHVVNIDPKANTWSCATCTVDGGGPVEWTMKAEGVSQRHAVELLRAEVASRPPPVAPDRPRGPVVRHSTRVKLGTPFEPSTDDRALLAQIAEYYHATLTQTPEALDYLEGRGLKSAEMIATFKLGYANRTLAYRLPAKNRVAGAEIRGRLEKLGVFRASGHEHLNGALVVPVADEGGHVVQLYGRRISPRLPSGASAHLHTPGTSVGLWNVSILRTTTEVVLCRSVFDGLTVWCAGHRNVVSTCSRDGLTAAEIEVLRGHGVERVKIAYRRDGAGDRAAADAARLLADAGIEAWKVLFPHGMDANDHAVKASLDVVEDAVRKAEWVGKGASPRTRPTPIPAPEDVPNVPMPTGKAMADADDPAAVDANVIGERAPSSEAGAKANTRFEFGDRTWRVRRIGNAGPEAMKINLYVAREGVGFHVDSLDLYSARQRAHYVALAVEIGVEERVIKRDLGEVLLRLEEEQDRAATDETEKKSLWVHLRRLLDGEFVVVHPSGRGRGFVYELAYAADGAATRPVVRRQNGLGSGDVRPSFGPYSGVVRGAPDSAIQPQNNGMGDSVGDDGPNEHPGARDGGSYLHEPRG